MKTQSCNNTTKHKLINIVPTAPANTTEANASANDLLLRPAPLQTVDASSTANAAAAASVAAADRPVTTLPQPMPQLPQLLPLPTHR
jgi:hypothetical protein